MVLVTGQMIICGWLFYKDRTRFLTGNDEDKIFSRETTKSSSSTSSKTELKRTEHRCSSDSQDSFSLFPYLAWEAILKLSGVVTLEELRDAIKEAIQLTLPNTGDVIVYLLHPETNDWVSKEGLAHTLPREGVGWHCVESRQRQQLSHIATSDPLSGLVTPSSSTASKRIVLCSPVVEKEDDSVIAVLLCNCDRLSDVDKKHLDFIEKQLSVCYRRIRRTLYSSSVRSQYNNNTPSSKQDDLLRLCAALDDPDPSQLQLKILRYLEEQTDAGNSFLLLVVPDTGELVCQVVGSKVLEEEVRFPNVNNSFASVLVTKQPITLAQITKEHKSDLVKLVGTSIKSLLCVPVLSRDGADVLAIACVANKRGANKFTDPDLDTINKCFKYATTILKSSLDLQAETFLKDQTQTLLQVAKTLFQNLGEYSGLVSNIITACGMPVHTNSIIQTSLEYFKELPRNKAGKKKKVPTATLR